MKKIKIPDHMFQQTIYFYVGGTEKELGERIKKEYGADLDFHAAQGKQFVLETKLAGTTFHHYCIWLQSFDWKVYQMGWLAHELLHLVFAILDDLGFKPSREASEEAYTYYFQRLYEATLEQMQKRKNARRKNKK